MAHPRLVQIDALFDFLALNKVVGWAGGRLAQIGSVWPRLARIVNITVCVDTWVRANVNITVCLDTSVRILGAAMRLYI